MRTLTEALTIYTVLGSSGPPVNLLGAPINQTRQGLGYSWGPKLEGNASNLPEIGVGAFKRVLNIAGKKPRLSGNVLVVD